VKQRLATEETNVADIALAKNVEAAAELVGIDPAEIAGANFAAGEVAEVASGVARVGDGDVAERRSARVMRRSMSKTWKRSWSQ